MFHSFHSLLFPLLGLTLLDIMLAVPIGDIYDPYNGTEWDSLVTRQEGGLRTLRIMPLGASITQGVGSTPQNGTYKIYTHGVLLLLAEREHNGT
jgi:hypothetical protein